MQGSLGIAAWLVAFAGSHFLLSSLAVRRALIARLGERGFQGLYSLVAIVTFVPLVMAWWQGRHAGDLLWHLRGVAPLYWLSIALSLGGFALMFLGILQPSPTGMNPGAPKSARGATRITRHAFFMGVTLWGVGHVLMNGWMNDVIFFGGLALFAWLGSLHQDARKRALDDGSLAEFYRETSVLPFGAILAGRNRLVVGEVSWLAVGLGLAAGLALFWYHDPLFR